MSDNKKYYYLKFKENFFDSEAMIILESMPDGYLYSNILIKLYLRSLKNEGKLMFNNSIPYNPTILAQVVRHSVGVVEKSLSIFKKLGLIEVLDNGAIYMLEIQNYIGISSNEADRKRQYRDRIESEQVLIGQMSDKCPDKSPPELKIELELKIEKEIKQDVDKPHMDIINYFNLKTGKEKYQKGSDKESIIKYVKDTLKSGDTIEDIKNLIDYKLASPLTKNIDLTSWLNSTYVGMNMSKSKTWIEEGKKAIIDQSFNKLESKESIELHGAI